MCQLRILVNRRTTANGCTPYEYADSRSYEEHAGVKR